MSDALNLAEGAGQYVELLPARTVLSCGGGGGGGDGYGGWAFGGDGGDGGDAVVAENVNFGGEQYNVAVGGDGGDGGDAEGGDVVGGE